MENFVVSARKYRPATFNTVVGQSSITNTLKNAIISNHLAQAFLFCGPRGVGKTTCARILAKTINCLNRREDGEACDTCDSCTSFNSGQSLNIYELDAASNNSVDDIRQLIDQVRFAPQLGNFKVYIIDEVHMLSSAAFNAFLKTLEEPPAHAIFILATTEKHKILPTILSRCQKFDFNRIKIEDMSSHLLEIAKKEGIEADADALHIISQKADGGLRDALSMFDQLVSFSGNHLTYKSVIENLNILDYDYYFKITDASVKGDIPGVLLLFNEILMHGFDGHNFIVGLAEHYRNLLVSKDPSTMQLLEVSDSIKQRYTEQTTKIPQYILLKAIEIANKCDLQYKISKNQRLLVELALMQLCSLNSTPAESEKKNDVNIPLPVAFKKNEAVISPLPQSLNAGRPAITATPVTQSAQQVLSQKTVVQAHPSLPSIEIEKGVPNPAVKKNFSTGLSLSSISGANKKEDKLNVVNEGEAAFNVNQKAIPFTQQQLIEAWEKYIQKITGQKRLTLLTALQISRPVLKDNFNIEFTVANTLQESEILNERTELIPFLKQFLQNEVLRLTIVVAEVLSTRQAYTPTEKFAKLAEKNPILIKFRQAFDLDF